MEIPDLQQGRELSYHQFALLPSGLDATLALK